MTQAFQADGLWRDDTVVFFQHWDDDPDHVGHDQHPECSVIGPHLMSDCGRFKPEPEKDVHDDVHLGELMPKLRPMPEAPQTPALRIAMERTADSRLLLDFLNWMRNYVFTDSNGGMLVRVTERNTGQVTIEDVTREDLIARFYGISADRIAADRRAIEEYHADKLRWFSERDAHNASHERND